MIFLIKEALKNIYPYLPLASLNRNLRIVKNKYCLISENLSLYSCEIVALKCEIKKKEQNY